MLFRDHCKRRISSRKFVIPVIKSFKVVAAILCCAALPGLVSAAPGVALGALPLKAGYLDETALVFNPMSRDNPLPRRILLPGVPLTFASDIKHACLSVHARQGDPLVYLPGTKICLSLTELFDLAREFHPDQSLTGVLMRDRQALQKGLETEALMVLQASPAYANDLMVDGAAAALQCYCPNPTGDVFADGFENIP